MDYSQLGEQGLIEEWFAAHPPVHGRHLLDIGAADGQTFSNSRHLALEGWTGTLVEASPVQFVRLLALYGPDTPHALVLAALDNVQRAARFHLTLDGPSPDAPLVSSLDAAYDHRRKWEATCPTRQIVVPTMTPVQLLAACPGPYDFLSLDTEGLNADLWDALPLASIGASLLCVEHDGQLPRFTDRAALAGYKLWQENGLNAFYVRS